MIANAFDGRDPAFVADMDRRAVTSGGARVHSAAELWRC
jgi:hypothetical protein